jgi:hypothetical protein
MGRAFLRTGTTFFLRKFFWSGSVEKDNSMVSKVGYTIDLYLNLYCFTNWVTCQKS